ncbi:hypothetical protein HanRHA438_Chr15g0702971 [Helianthus annuus]|uniref:Uncharacterized protein n=1 Tax=Helianthus annuus TaxID=4232 RepID=A0A251UKI8_HELAN|nr:uncharacterized protein LOC110938423 [Helianthus annuus]KAF5764303.1 hypothetical protein HanXRQr2_Chr15g0690491 [Helianthus annuus]KAJ0451001.1 hypothetical protein HanHA300_Chr15g0562641 [Helianthus annuus]KAJ0455370.1 hypothetical protein HanIR_Chr15g0750431 [Helianthus annuus]KAJ0472860.1 hypothetical protein HanHA89_Chr15g0611841 [Helianthus annuus]KAJ0648465.1 hypothetical protein HanLR1_Chr15g0573241 [Helianthus annuus]
MHEYHFPFFFLSSKSKVKCETETDPQTTPLITNADDHNLQLQNPTTAIALVLTSWLHGRRLRYLLLALCLPFLIPIVFASIPVVCVMEICFRLYRRQLKSGPPQDLEGGGGEAVDLDLFERYLEDQLGLVLEVACECEYEYEYEYDSGGDQSGDCFGDC